ncbi:GDYXXLXY domain-containing protein [Aeromonas cavernicola]|uniref:GDYXXLXY domain-containing protein n=1 Tax=Aeromonas cavernicola TaxID=1006623 RepID=A0A2H9U0A8_9GAMM|nr:GDYXXLXY domain-containing protein [Aeromonas cavernicola]PJG57451.1 hypothetical protein CUC53_17915 [Aeromonas cavernicola]
MSSRIQQRLGLLLSGIAILAGINVVVWRYEQAISSGEMVLLQLAPVDPRSLMQGDYMRLDYQLARDVASQRARQTDPLALTNQYDTLVIRLDDHQVASWVVEGNPAQLSASERRLQVRQYHQQWLIGPDAFFFEEGTGELFEAARYGEFRLQENGKALLVGLRDSQYQPIGQVRGRW